MARSLHLHLKVWRQASANAKGYFQDIEARDIPESASFLEMMDIVNQRIITSGGDPIAFDHDCREGICGMCSMVINGRAHGPERSTTTCQLHMRKFHDGDTIWIEPFRAVAFPVIKDLAVDRTSFDKIQIAGGFISVRTGSVQDANALPISKEAADASMDAAECIGCGACVAACPNASAMLFTSAKAGQLNMLPQGQPEKHRRVLGMVRSMDAAGFGNCSNHYECEGACPKDISVRWIAKMNRDYALATVHEAVIAPAGKGGGDGAG
ncbi:succinate dehydrogenase / fumarate reductase iron-sulfur subunit [Roseimicrobium gellanilyticum]|uniref:Succinate dehydrogenase / fumarate reductase iron-sulfur subunit n=1 Tax=Roseimicrobium gellanilyticum TaxID=748857 RepID=A0A366HFS4_9BACT|nr:succinate dehydrogenase/fumarate reductase iron-sulfur subunit [Roseimicrobium gellanilyticum]RBP41412.1 succinate dehydrogenase / fumarate reductase iron-sulfur subunit [Roseimicrobium gellanilyticum]